MTASGTRTSESDPIRVHWVPDLPTAGALGLTLAPGKHGQSFYHPAGWARDLDADLDRLRRHHRADVLVSLIEDHECDLLGIPDLRGRARDAGLEVRHFPITDGSVPPPWRGDAFAELVAAIRRSLDDGRRVVVHCRGGVGRSGLVAAAVATTCGDDADAAIARVREAQPHAVETREQEAYVGRFAVRAR
ncbi:MAG: cyclin-dependent kinase inhibitor 3 family protein [Trueperaceae bacterium]|nr:cyclin-dependent kinase inhibitor 3 family protein [Trueperaceae bacterium]